MIRSSTLLAIAACLVMTSGCASSGLFGPKTGHPDKIVLLLTPSRLENAGEAPRQGMMCRSYFFKDNDPTPMKVKGDLVLTAFDRGRHQPNGPPEGLYQIPESKLANHYRKDIVGASYLFWLPYDPQDDTQMVVQGFFRSKKGREVESGLVAVDLTPSVTVARSSSGPGKLNRDFSGARSSRPHVTMIERDRRNASGTPVETIRRSPAGPGAGERPAAN